LADKRDVDAYICVKLPSGSYLCTISNSVVAVTGSDTYNRGFIDGRSDAYNRMIDFLKSEQS